MQQKINFNVNYFTRLISIKRV